MGDRDLFTAAGAAIYAKSAGKPYRPSNGTEGELFYENWCADCRRDAAYRRDEGDSCDIVACAMAFNIGDPDYPKEWVIGADGQPKCTAFEEERSAS